MDKQANLIRISTNVISACIAFVVVSSILIGVGVTIANRNACYIGLIDSDDQNEVDYCKVLESSQIWNLKRLLTNIKPIHYHLHLSFMHLEHSYFNGTVKIRLNISNASNIIVLYASRLRITQIELLNSQNGSKINVKCSDLKNEYFALITQDVLEPRHGQFEIKLEFTGKIFKKQEGLFLVPNGRDSKRNAFASYFEYNHARKVFPCFDEPGFKADYNITIDHPDNTTVLFNTQLKDIKVGTKNGLAFKRSHFATRLQLPTYSLSFVLFQNTDYNRISSLVDSTQVSIWTRKELQYCTKDALTLVLIILREFNQYFSQTEKVLPVKIDIITFTRYPIDANVHLGLAIFNEESLLFKQNHISEYRKQEIALLVARKLANFWFGDLVSATGWDAFWIEQGLNRFISYKIVNAAFKDWSMNEQLIAEEIVDVLNNEAYATAQPILSQLDILKLNKASKVNSILRMLESEIGEDAIKNYLNGHIQKYKNKNADYTGLFSDPGSKIRNWSTEHFIDEWFKNPSYPVVQINLTGNTSNKTVSIRQNRFIKSAIGKDEVKYRWPISVKCIFGSSFFDTIESVEEFVFDFDTEQYTVELPNSENFHWLHCNRDFNGLYIVEYSFENWLYLNRLITRRTSRLFTLADRANLIQNLFLNAYSGAMTYFELKELLLYLEKETDYLPWRVFQKNLDTLLDSLQYKDTFSLISKFFSDKILGRVALDLWKPTVNHLDSLLKMTVLELQCRLQDFYCLNDVMKLPFLTLNLPQHTRQVVYNYQIENTYKLSSIEFSLKMYWNKTDDPQESRKLFEALTYSRTPWVLSQIFNYTNSYTDAIKSLSKNPLGRQLLWDFCRLNYDKNGEALISIAKTIDSKLLYDQLGHFIQTSQSDIDFETGLRALECASTNIAWLTNREDEIMNAFT